MIKAPALLLAVTALSLAGCSALGADGPSRSAIGRAGSSTQQATLVVPITDAVATGFGTVLGAQSLAGTIGEGSGMSQRLAPGDQLSVSLFEAPPAVLFGVVNASSMGTIDAAQTSRGLAVSDQVVDRDGTISVPFAGTIRAAGRTTRDIEAAIVARLRGRANQPTAIVRIVRKGSAEIVVVGDVATPGRFPLSPKGERLLDIIAAAGGSRQPIGKMAVRVERGGRSATIAMEQLTRNPLENIRLDAGDIVSLLYQPNQFVAMGAVNKPAEYDFEATGVSLVQALGRVGGLKSDRADIKGVFVFRYETPANLPPSAMADRYVTAQGVVPTIYRVDLTDPTQLFAARRFAMKDQDVLYVSTAPAADLQRLISAVSSGVFSIAGLRNL